MVVGHNGTVLFLVGFEQYDVHRFHDVVFHALRVGEGSLKFGFGLIGLAYAALVLFFELLEDPPFMLVDDFVKMAVVLFYFGLLLLQSFTDPSDCKGNHLLLLSKHSHSDFQLPQKGVNLFFPRVHLHTLSNLQLDDRKALTSQQNGALLAVVKGFLLTVDDVLGSFVRVIDAGGFGLAATGVDAVGDAGFGATGAEWGEGGFGVGAVGSVGEVHAIWVGG